MQVRELVREVARLRDEVAELRREKSRTPARLALGAHDPSSARPSFGRVDTYGDLPGSDAAGDGHLVMDEGVLYVWAPEPGEVTGNAWVPWAPVVVGVGANGAITVGATTSVYAVGVLGWDDTNQKLCVVRHNATASNRYWAPADGVWPSGVTPASGQKLSGDLYEATVSSQRALFYYNGTSDFCVTHTV